MVGWSFPWETDPSTGWCCASSKAEAWRRLSVLLRTGAGVGMENSWLGPQGKSLEKSDLTLIHSPSSYVKIWWKTLLVSSSPGVSHFPSRDIFVIRHPGTLIIGNIYMWLGQKPPVVVDLLEVGSVTSSLALASSLCSPSVFPGISPLALGGTCPLNVQVIPSERAFPDTL